MRTLFLAIGPQMLFFILKMLLDFHQVGIRSKVEKLFKKV